MKTTIEDQIDAISAAKLGSTGDMREAMEDIQEMLEETQAALKIVNIDAHQHLLNPQPDNEGELLRKLTDATNEVERLKMVNKELYGTWEEVYTYVSKHEEIRVGDSISQTALKFLKERDALTEIIRAK